MAFAPPRKVLITGALGNLGRKLIDHLLTLPWCESIVGVDIAGDAAPFAKHDRRVQIVFGDPRDWNDRRWKDALSGVEGIAHFAAQRPYEDADWIDVSVSIDITANLLEASAAAGVRRFVFATSNHVMGGYKDAPLANTIGRGTLTTALMPAPGTKVRVGDRASDSTPYATTKLMGERLCRAKALATNGKLTTVATRIGWCQPGANEPRTMNLSGTPSADAPPPANADEARDLKWFRSMWLSNRDFLNLFERALVADPAGWPEPGITVNGMSANKDMPWDIETTKRLIGYQPKDDVWSHVK
ncbi:MAG TPA: NAD(P)-dependent oxidoreductase [Magnetospirillaceae bacterium]|jgi:nucleoside-diphosphate-sugar epimerase